MGSIIPGHQGTVFSELHSTVFQGELTFVQILSTSETAFHRLSRKLKIVGRKAELFNGFSKRSPDVKELKEGAVEIQMEILEFLTNLITHFRAESFGELLYSSPTPVLLQSSVVPNQFHHLSENEDSSWRPAVKSYQNCIRRIDEAFERIERLAQLVHSDSRMDEVTRLQKLLSLTPEAFHDKAKLPCIVLPAMKNNNVYDREDLIQKIDTYFQTIDASNNDQKPKSLALYGLGGVGKSQIALKYAQKRIQERSIDVVLWTYSETATALAQSFTDLAQRLELSGANEQHHEKNKVLVLDWLQRTRTLRRTLCQI